MRELSPEPEARGLRFCLVAARFNEAYVRRLADAAAEVLRHRGAAEEDLERWWVPGSFELPLACRWAGASGRFDAVLAFGVVIRGETEHFRLVADAASDGLLRAGLDTGVPVLNGVLAAHDAEQAAARSGGVLGNRGAEVALAAVHMARLRRAVEAR
ncbi:MAG: 6,7-dimethyl-8-ribityllumazine synthase [Candidatus Eisenbacteria bacterium]